MPLYRLRILALCLLLYPFGLYAADFELSIPIKLERMMPDVGEVMVTCRVTSEDEDVIGEGQQKLRLEQSSYQGNIVVSFDADLGKDPNAATLYQCTMRLRQVSGREYLIPQSEEEEPDWPIWARARADAELVYQVEGSLSGEAPAQEGGAPQQ